MFLYWDQKTLHFRTRSQYQCEYRWGEGIRLDRLLKLTCCLSSWNFGEGCRLIAVCGLNELNNSFFARLTSHKIWLNMSLKQSKVFTFLSVREIVRNSNFLVRARIITHHEAHMRHQQSRVIRDPWHNIKTSVLPSPDTTKQNVYWVV